MSGLAKVERGIFEKAEAKRERVCPKPIPHFATKEAIPVLRERIDALITLRDAIANVLEVFEREWKTIENNAATLICTGLCLESESIREVAVRPFYRIYKRIEMAKELLEDARYQLNMEIMEQEELLSDLEREYGKEGVKSE